MGCDGLRWYIHIMSISFYMDLYLCYGYSMSVELGIEGVEGMHLRCVAYCSVSAVPSM